MCFRIVQSYAAIMNDLERSSAAFTQENGRALLRRIEWCGRISHRSEDAQTEDSWKRFIKSVVLDHGDWSITEHASVSVDFLVDRGITHEIVRHRLFSFTQESTRFVNYKKKLGLSFIAPCDLAEENRVLWEVGVKKAACTYQMLLDNGAAPQMARSVLPNSLASRLIVSGNLRNWRHFLLMRTTKESHPQMRKVTIPLLQEFQQTIPLLFDDIEPEERQARNIEKGR